jgi:hypothetical protein
MICAYNGIRGANVYDMVRWLGQEKSTVVFAAFSIIGMRWRRSKTGCSLMCTYIQVLITCGRAGFDRRIRQKLSTFLKKHVFEDDP